VKLKPALKLIAALVISGSAGAVGTLFTISAIPAWYATLAKPALNPPTWVFGPVWTALYALMGIAAFLVWNKGWGRADVRKALGFFLLQLALNAVWSIIFFGWHDILSAFICIAALWLTIVWTMMLFYRISKPTMYILLPYILWVSFAAYLNYSILMLN